MREENGHASHSNGAVQPLFLGAGGPGGGRWPVPDRSAGGRPGVVPTLPHAAAKAAVRQPTKAFGVTEPSVHEGADGTVTHAEPVQGGNVVTLGTEGHGRVYVVVD